jgi:hypothetical protein
LMDQDELLDVMLEEESETNNIQEGRSTDFKNSDDKDDYEENKAESMNNDEEIAFYNLALAEKILITQQDKNSLNLLANLYHKFGELEMCKSDFKEAILFFQKALDIRKNIEDKFSRAIAELYFNMGSIYDFDSNKCLLCYYKTKVIIEYHLKQELKEAGNQIVINESDLDLDSVDRNKIIFYKDALENENFSEEANELVDIINQIYTKVKYNNLDRRCYPGYRATREL